MLERLEGSDRALRAAYAKIEASLQAQRRFTADASHELRTPLTSIRGYAGLLRQFVQVTPEDRVAAIAQIDREADRMSRLVEDLLTLARADSGQPLAREPVPLVPLLEDIVEQVRALDGGEHPLDLRVETPIVVTGDPDALRQLGLILLDNAVKYTPPGGRVALTVAVDGDRGTIAVTDTGVGISPGALPHIFERFYRAHRRPEAGQRHGTWTLHSPVDRRGAQRLDRGGELGGSGQHLHRAIAPRTQFLRARE